MLGIWEVVRWRRLLRNTCCGTGLARYVVLSHYVSRFHCSGLCSFQFLWNCCVCSNGQLCVFTEEQLLHYSQYFLDSVNQWRCSTHCLYVSLLIMPSLSAKLPFRLYTVLSLSLSFPVGGWGACHGPDRLQKGPHASRISWVDVVGGGACRCVWWTAKKKLLSHLVVASAVRTHWRLLSSDAVEVAGQKPTVARPQLGNSDALASGPAKSPVCLRVGISSEGAVSGWVRVAFVAGLKLLLSCPPDQDLCRCQINRNQCLRKGGAPLGFQICQCVARNANVRWDPLNVDTGGFTDGGEMRSNWDAGWVRLMGRTSWRVL